MTKLNEGLVIGKMCPITFGHITMFSMALAKCDTLNVVVCIDHLHDPDCPMSPEQRIASVRAECAKISDRITVHSIDCTAFPYAKEDDLEVSKYWAKVLKERFPNTRTLFGSEEYVKMMADNWPDCLGVAHEILDKDRKTTHISATMVRENPRRYWKYIPDSVKPFYTKNILVLGAESCGKTTLTVTLGRLLGAPVVPEMYRSIYLDKGMDFTPADLNRVAVVQTKAQHEAARSFFNKGVVLHDTCCEITKMYLREYFSQNPTAEYHETLDLIDQSINREVHFDVIFFCDTDVKWENDGTRTLGSESDRKRMRDAAYSIAVQKANRHNAKLIVLPADYKRIPAAMEALEEIL